jgi:hypothetical protein
MSVVEPLPVLSSAHLIDHNVSLPALNGLVVVEFLKMKNLIQMKPNKPILKR